MKGPRDASLRRWVLVALLALGLAPGTWLRTDIPVQRSADFAIAPLGFQKPRDWPANLALEGLWAIRSPDPMFGGYSALVRLSPGRVLAYSDRGDSLAFTLPGHGSPRPRFARVRSHRSFPLEQADIESATRDPASGTIWLGYERSNALGRFPGGSAATPRVRRRAPMIGWPGNSGPEAMARLGDGRFLVLGEGTGTGLLFAYDPLEGAPFERFEAVYPAGFRPTDAAQLPDGRVLVLLREVALGWPPFRSRLAIFDPELIGSEAPWRAMSLARLDGPLPRENYEAILVEPEGDGAVIWLMSDDNLSAFQRTLLVKLRWRPDAP